MDSFSRTPSKMSNLSISSSSLFDCTLNQSYEIIEEYLANANIEFDLFQFSQKPNFNCLVILLNFLYRSVKTQIVHFVPNYEQTAQKMNLLFSTFYLHHRVTKTDLMNMTHNKHSLETVIKPIANLVKSRLEPIFQLNQRYEMMQNCKREFDFSLEQIFCCDSDVTQPVALFSQLRQSNLSFDSFQALIHDKIKQQHEVIRQEIRKIEDYRDQKTKELKDAKRLIDNTPEMFKDSRLLEEFKAKQVAKFEQVKLTYAKLVDRYREKEMERIRSKYLSKFDQIQTKIGDKEKSNKNHSDCATWIEDCAKMIKQNTINSDEVKQLLDKGQRLSRTIDDQLAPVEHDVTTLEHKLARCVLDIENYKKDFAKQQNHLEVDDIEQQKELNALIEEEIRLKQIYRKTLEKRNLIKNQVDQIKAKHNKKMEQYHHTKNALKDQIERIMRKNDSLVDKLVQLNRKYQQQHKC